MYRFFSLIARRQDVSDREFHDHWRHPHGTMGRQIPSLRDYVQAHRIRSESLPDDPHPVEGLAIASFDTLDDARGLLDDQHYLTLVQPDEPSFQDLANNAFFCTTEEVLQSRAGADHDDPAAELWDVLDLPVSVQLLQFVHVDGNPAWEGPEDVELGREVGAFRHARNRAAGGYHGTDLPFLGVRQLWWPTLTAFERSAEIHRESLERLLGQAGQSTTILTSTERWLR